MPVAIIVLSRLPQLGGEFASLSGWMALVPGQILLILRQHLLITVSGTDLVMLPHGMGVLEYAAMILEIKPAPIALPDRFPTAVHMNSLPQNKPGALVWPSPARTRATPGGDLLLR